METKDDKILKTFFGDKKQEIADNGFSEKVMLRLPQRERKTGWIAPVFALIGFLITFALVDMHEVAREIFIALSGIPFYYLLGGFMLIPIVTMLVLYAYKREYNIA